MYSKNLVKALSLAMAFCIAFLLAMPVAATTVETAGLDALDVIVASAAVLKPHVAGEEPLVPDTAYAKEIIPLYDQDSNIIAYYASFAPNGYTVIYNSKENPTAIEFGANDNMLIREILNNNPNPHIIYVNPLYVYEYTENAVNTIDSVGRYDLYDFYPDLRNADYDLSEMVQQMKESVLRLPMPAAEHSTMSYGFLTLGDLPTNEYIGRSHTLVGADTMNWLTTGDVEHLATNHCGAVAATNIALYYGTHGYDKLLQGSNAWGEIKVETL